MFWAKLTIIMFDIIVEAPFFPRYRVCLVKSMSTIEFIVCMSMVPLASHFLLEHRFRD
jgi:hypothetical protein